MTESTQHINYSFEDIQRYLQGKMSATEMHAIEKAALQDSFLADAIEGFSETDQSTATEKINEINVAFTKQESFSKVVALRSNTQWLRIAAMIIILAGAGFTGFYFLKNTGKEKNIALAKVDSSNVATLSNKDSLLQNKVADLSAKTDTQKIVASNESKNRKDILTEKNNTPPHSNAMTAMALSSDKQMSDKSFSAKTETDTIRFDMKANANSSSVANASDEINIQNKIFKGKITDENKQPVIGATIKSADNNAVAVTDASGNFILNENDNSANVVASALGYTTQTVRLQPDAQNFIELKNNSAALNNVTITAFGNAKKSNAISPSPVGGWENFNHYVISELSKDTTDFLSDKDAVELEFLIDDDGSPYNIKITKPLDEQHNSEAIAILKDGPKWTTTSKKRKAKVVIPFKSN